MANTTNDGPGFQHATNLFLIGGWYLFLVQANGITPVARATDGFMTFAMSHNSNVADVARHFTLNGITPVDADAYRTFAVRF